MLPTCGTVISGSLDSTDDWARIFLQTIRSTTVMSHIRKPRLLRLVTMTILELDTPQICRGAFQRVVEGTKLVAEVRTSSSTAISTSCQPTRIFLPSSVDVTKILQPGGIDHGDAGGKNTPRLGEALSVEILGCGQEATFSIGTAAIEIPQNLRPSFNQSGCRSNTFCAVVEDGTGNRAGTLSGTFLPQRKSDGIPALPKTQEKAINASAPGKSYWDPTFQEPLDKDNGADHSGDLSRKAIDLLETASTILNSSPLAFRQGPQIASRYGDGVLAGTGLTETEDKNVQNNSTLTQGATSSVQVTHKSTDDKVQVNIPTNVPTNPTWTMDDQERAICVPTAGFRFEPTTGSVNWQRVAAVNVSKMEREGNLQAVKRFIPEVAVGRVNADDVDANPGLLNAFRLAQLQVQYVLHCQQILQGQCDGLQSAVSNMELEVEENTRGKKAMKDRVRLLRRESREQDKIINSYSAMLRAHNPGLAAKVRLDGKGRLRVFNVDETTRERGRRSHRRSHSRGRGDSSGVPNLRKRQPKTGDTSNDIKTTTYEARPGLRTPPSGRSDADYGQVSSKAASTAGIMGTLEAERGRNEVSSTAEGPRSLRRDSKIDADEAFALGGYRFVQSNRSYTADARRGLHPRGGSVTESGESETDVRERHELNSQRDSSGGKSNAARDGGAETSSESGDKQAVSPLGIGGSQVELPYDGLDRTPRVVTVQVKPMRPTAETLTPPKRAEGHISACLHDKAEENALCSGDRKHAQEGYVDSSGARLSKEKQIPTGKAMPNPNNVHRVLSRKDGISASLGGRDSDDFNDNDSSGDGINSAIAKGEGNGRVFLGTPPAKTTSKLGLEEEGLANAVVEFDLDDISEIDAGGEWVATGEGDVEGSVSP